MGYMWRCGLVRLWRRVLRWFYGRALEILPRHRFRVVPLGHLWRLECAGLLRRRRWSLLLTRLRERLRRLGLPCKARIGSSLRLTLPASLAGVRVSGTPVACRRLIPPIAGVLPVRIPPVRLPL